jgi:hypothetical protein
VQSDDAAEPQLHLAHPPPVVRGEGGSQPPALQLATAAASIGRSAARRLASWGVLPAGQPVTRRRIALEANVSPSRDIVLGWPWAVKSFSCRPVCFVRRIPNEIYRGA